MQFIATEVDGSFLVTPRKHEDHRGFFARAWCTTTLRDKQLVADIRQSNMAVSRLRGTLRGLHYQRSPHQEVKFMRCVRGEIFGVVADVRPDSPTFGHWDGHVLDAQNHNALYVPEGCAVGYQTLQDDCEIYYHSSADFAPDFATGIRYDDPVFDIRWPLEISEISVQDQEWPDLQIKSNAELIGQTGTIRC